MRTKAWAIALASSALLLACASAHAANSGSTVQCKDGTYSTSRVKLGACRGHGGLKHRLGEPKAKVDTGKAAARDWPATGNDDNAGATAKSARQGQ